MSELKDKIALVTGGGSGIGKAISKRFAAAGAEVHIFDRDEAGSNGVVQEIADLGGRAIHHTGNVTDQKEVLALVDKMCKIDILVNNAGIAHVGNVEKCAEADFERVFQVNVKGAYNLLYAVVPLMKAQGGGVVLNLASIAALVGISDRFAYSMSKGAIHAMTLSVARDYLHDGIRCNSISPARVHTPFVDGFIQANYPGQEAEMFEKLSKSQPIGRMATPDEIAKLALFLCSDDAAFITGNDYPIDGGFIKLNN
ncbi:glucose 1-dehydrogenase [Sphingobacterium sp. lm-10]|uniref:SDR family NAD(P)-dependent oxidoreductase n=1 Tax=Sphingobacterium sp. lm-10 TaxID=2944904 RepID=UPI00202187E6|nr:glucose 1-dehydrogenase [Sphingobacterium sp. lm-10]MCL7987648.1 glucose 1-dehydrogenase [Sphingobacterium sp. lm-10]